MEDDREEQEGLTADELIAVLTGKCVHEVQLGRIMGLLGLAAASVASNPSAAPLASDQGSMKNSRTLST